MRKILLLLSFILPVAIACNRVDPESGGSSAIPPESYVAIVRAYRSGLQYRESKAISSAVKVFFADGTGVVVRKDDMRIDDCTAAEPLAVSYDGASGRWMVGGEDSGVSRTNGSDEESMPVYGWFDIRYLKIYAANGSVLEFDNGCEEPAPGPEPGPDPDPQPQPGEPYSIPTVYITTEGKAPINSKEDYVPGSIRVVDKSMHFSDRAEFEGVMKIKGRGNTTWGMPKKPWKIKLEEKTSILGMPKDKEWCLLANYSDKTLMRNFAAFRMSEICDMSWTPRGVSVDVYLNGEYQGVYVFTEHKKVSKDRVNIDDGDFYLEIEEAMDEPVCFKTTKFGVPVMFHEPENPSSEQQTYVKEWFRGFEQALEDIQNKHDYKTYRQYIDVPSFIKYYIIEEVAKDPDGNIRKSTFLTKQKDRKLEMYHVWDFDITMGNCNYTGFEKTDGWQMKGATWYNKMFQDPGFVKEVKAMWTEVYPELCTVTDYINGQIDLLDGAQYRNFERWDILDKYVWPNVVWLGDYDREVLYFYEYLDKRLEWLDGEIRKW